MIAYVTATYLKTAPCRGATRGQSRRGGAAKEHAGFRGTTLRHQADLWGGFVDPEGDFVEAIGRQHSAEQAARIIREHMGDWKDGVKKG